MIKTAYDAGVKLAMHEEETKGPSFSWGKAALPIASILGGILLGRGLGGKIGSALGYGLSKGKIGPTLAGESAGRFAGGTAGGLAGLFGSAALVQRGQQGGESQTPPFNSSDFRESLRLNPKSPELDEAFGMYQQDTGNQIGQMSQQDINDYIRQIRGLSAGQY